MELSFLDLKEREIINVFDGKKLGRIVDIVFNNETGIVRGIVVPGDKKIFRKDDDIFVPIDKIKRIGNDVILIGIQNENRLIKNKSRRDVDKNIRTYENYYNRNYNGFQNYNCENNSGIQNANYFGQNLQKNAINAKNNANNEKKSPILPKSYVRLKPISRNKYK